VSVDLYLNADGDLVWWADLDAAERSFYSDPKPYIVTEFGLNVAEYVAKIRADEVLASVYDDSYRPTCCDGSSGVADFW
jgi:hypothetical protein